MDVDAVNLIIGRGLYNGNYKGYDFANRVDHAFIALNTLRIKYPHMVMSITDHATLGRRIVDCAIYTGGDDSRRFEGRHPRPAGAISETIVAVLDWEEHREYYERPH